MKDVVVSVNVAKPIQLVSKVTKIAVSPVAKLGQHIVREQANTAMASLMATDEGRLQLFNMLLEAGAASREKAE